MNAKSKRPSVFSLDSMMVGQPEASEPKAVETVKQNTPARKAASEKSFRTSVFLSFAAHDVLRDIAHEERKTFADLFREGLDHVLTSRNYPTTAELERKKE
jgi:tRNA A37 threonylcarbamoyladenosine dehydratase